MLLLSLQTMSNFHIRKLLFYEKKVAFLKVLSEMDMLYSVVDLSSIVVVHAYCVLWALITSDIYS